MPAMQHVKTLTGWLILKLKFLLVSQIALGLYDRACGMLQAFECEGPGQARADLSQTVKL